MSLLGHFGTWHVGMPTAPAAKASAMKMLNVAWIGKWGWCLREGHAAILGQKIRLPPWGSSDRSWSQNDLNMMKQLAELGAPAQVGLRFASIFFNRNQDYHSKSFFPTFFFVNLLYLDFQWRFLIPRLSWFLKFSFPISFFWAINLTHQPNPSDQCK